MVPEGTDTERGEPKPRVRRRRGPAVAFGAMMLAAGIGAIVVAGGMEGSTARVLGGNSPVNAGAVDRLDVTAQNSPVVVANPRNSANLAVANRVDAPKFSCGLHTSFDGGATWAETKLALPESDVVACFAPDVAFGADGVLYLAYTSFAKVEGLGTIPDAVWVARSSDGGRTLSPAVKAHGPLAFQMRISADPVKTGRLYLSWLQAADSLTWGLGTERRPIVVSRSDDGGATWGAPVTATAPERQRPVAPAMAIGSEGELYLSYLDVGDDRLDYHGGHQGLGGEPYAGKWTLVVARSPDGGATWAESVVDAGVVPTQRFLMLFPPAPSVAAATKGHRVYLAFHDGRLGDADVWVWSSKDGGKRWGAARRVNDTVRRDRTSQYLPQLDVAADGRLDVVYYDRRRDPKDVRNEVSLQSSFDDGSSFGPRLRLSDRSFDSTIGFGASRNLPDLGNRLGLLATDTGALGLWGDTRAEEREIAKQDLAKGLVVFSGGDEAKNSLKTVGVGVATVGALIALVAVAGARRRKGMRGVGESA